MMRQLIVVLAFLASLTANADTVLKYGANVSKPNEPLGSVKSLFVNYQKNFFGPFVEQYEVGGWVDNSGVSARRSSALVDASFGVHVNSDIFFAQALSGPALISCPDSALGGPFQFNNDFAFGLRDPKTKATVGINYKHVSSAGIELPNRGRDFLLFRLSIPW